MGIAGAATAPRPRAAGHLRGAAPAEPGSGTSARIWTRTAPPAPFGTTAAVLGARGAAAAAIALGAAGAIAAVAVYAGPGRWAEGAASVVACVLGSAVPLLAAPSQRRAAHRCAAITGGALVYAMGLAAP